MKIRHFLRIFAILVLVQTAFSKPPLTIIIVIDQFAYHYIPKMKPHWHDGFRRLFDGGIRYENAYMPHGMTATAPGHAGLNTGTFAKDHGFINNYWINKAGAIIACDDDSAQQAAVFKTPTSWYDTGKSAHSLMVDGLSDQWVLSSSLSNPASAYSVSLKSRAAIATAGRLGKAIWFDSHTGQFTSSKAYFATFPPWLAAFNTDHQITADQHITWTSIFAPESAAYEFVDNKSYQHTHLTQSLVNTTITRQRMGDQTCPNDDTPDTFLMTPTANQLVFDLALACIKQVMIVEKKPLLLWVCVSSPDKVGHHYGPASIEIYDMFYHLDEQIGSFMRAVDQLIAEKPLYMLTADHGVSPIPELTHTRGYDAAIRVDLKGHMKTLNKHIERIYKIPNAICAYKTPYVYLNNDAFTQVRQSVKRRIIAGIKKYLHDLPGIKRVWTYKELDHRMYEPYSLEYFFKQQLFPGRSGDLIVQTYPYTIDTRSVGTDHHTPYEYNTHIPLVFYWPSVLKPQAIEQKVWALQCASSLAQLMGIAKPSATTFEALPGLLAPPLTQQNTAAPSPYQ